MSFWGMLTGKSARKDIDAGIAAVKKGQQQAADAFTTYGSQATDTLKPTYQTGQLASNTRANLLGLNGADAERAAYDAYSNNPGFAAQRQQDLIRSGRQQNASGSFNSGTAAKADAYVRTAGLNNYIENQLGGVAREGEAAGSQIAGIQQGTGAGIAGTYQNASGQTAGLYGQRAQTQNTLGQNLIGLGGVVASAFGAPGFGVNRLGGQQQVSPGTNYNGGWQTTTQQAPWYQRIFS